MQLAHHVEASSDEVGRILETILAVVIGAGAEVHPEARLREVDGAMSVHCTAQAEGRTLVRMPRELLIPVDGATWADSTAMLRLESAPEGLTAIQRDLLDLHVALYNAAGKIPWIVRNHPKVALREEPELVEAIRRIRPGFGETWDLAAEVFLATRVFGLEPPPIDGAAESAGPATSVLLPVVDLMNHHPRGAPLSMAPKAMTVQIARQIGTDECFASYGRRRDALGLALHYAFLERETAIALSAPLRVDLPGLGEISVGGQEVSPVHPLDPPLIRDLGEELSLSHVTFNARHPEWMRTVLGLAVEANALLRGLPQEVAQAASEALIAAAVESNLAALDDLARVARQAQGPAAALVASAAVGQAQVIGEAAQRGPSGRASQGARVTEPRARPSASRRSSG